MNMKMSARCRWLCVTGLCAGVLCTAPATAADRVPRPADQDPHRIVTPHVAWGKPLAGGPIRMLAIVRGGGSRELYELAQRLEIQFDLVSVHLGHQFDPGSPFSGFGEGADRLGEYIAKKPDVFLIGNIRPLALPIELHYQMAKQVSEGAGLVCVDCEPWQGLGPGKHKLLGKPVGWFANTLSAVPYSQFRRVVATGLERFEVHTMGGIVTDYYETSWSPGTEGVCYRVGKGRLAAIGGHDRLGSWARVCTSVLPATQTPPERPTMPEYLYSMMAKAVRWAAGRRPAVRLSGFQQEGGRIRPMDAGWKNHASYVNEGPAWTGTLKAVVRGRWGDVLHSRAATVTLPPGRGVFPIKLRTGRLPAGDHTIDCWLVDKDKKVVDWGSCALTAERNEKVRVRMDQAWFEPGQPVKATVSVRDPHPKLQYGLTVQLRDSDGRILARKTHSVAKGAGSVPVSLRIPRPNGIVYYLESYLDQIRGKARWPIAYAKAKFTVPIRQRDAYYVSFNDSRQMTHLSRLRTRMSRLYGADCHRTYGVGKIQVVATAHYGQSPAPFFTHVGGCGFLGVATRCLSAPKYRQHLFDGVKHLATQLKPFGASCYNLGDDTGICRLLCKQPGCFGRFVAAMKKKYRTVAAMNKVWGTGLTRFEDVTIDWVERQRTAKSYGPWLDYLYWHEDMYCETFKRCNDIVRSVDPHAWVGQDASHYRNVLDVYMEGCTYVAPYFNRVLAKQIGSFRSQPGFYGACTGAYAGCGRIPQNQCIPWDLVFADNNAILFWTMSYGGTGDLTLHPRGYQMEEIRELKEGIANLFIHATRQDDAVMLYHSRASKHATGIESRIGYQRLSEENFSAIVEDLGLQARWTATQRAERGEIVRLRPKVVILPYAQALSDKEAAVLERFVREGGTLLADARPGVYTFHCQPRAVGALDKVFGIKRRPMKDYTRQGTLVMNAALGSLKPGQAVTETIVDTSVSATTARPLATLAGAPAVLVNRYGKGTAVLLNFFVGRYESLLDAGQADGLRALYREILGQAGVTRTVVATVAGRDAPGVELVRFADGPVTLLGVAKRALSCETYPMAVDLKLPAKYHVYDMRDGTYLGHKDRCRIDCAVMQRKALALLPYQIGRLKLAVAPVDSAPAGGVLRVTASVATSSTPGRHLIRFEAIDPSGRPCLWFRDKVWAAPGPDATVRATTHWPLALNEQPGKWTIRATDVLSGTTAEATVRVHAK